MILSKLIASLEVVETHGTDLEREIETVEFDSRKVRPATLFVAVRGTLTDGHKYIENAISTGATAVICEEVPEKISSDTLYIVVRDSASALSRVAAQFFGNPSRELKLVGVTGTNGKTTTATLLYGLFMALGCSVGLLSTVENFVAAEHYPATHTTPDPLELNALLRRMVEAGCEYCFMEVSSHGVAQRRVEGLEFAGGVFTNLTHDHLDYHGTFAEYLKVKKTFFDGLPKEAFVITNIDDRNGDVMLQNCVAKRRSYSLRMVADYRTKVVESHLDGMLLEINGKQAWMRFIGRFNAYNLTAIYGVAVELGVDPDEVLRVLSTLEPVAGRMQTVRGGGGILGVVDYAHTPDALKNVLDTIAEFRGAGRVVTVVGCGGDRDKAKRPVMAQIAADGSDRVVLTSDNPRTERPADILKDMTAGLDPVQIRSVLVIEDRAQAIRTAVALASDADGSIILVAGKGHETYQEVNGEKTHFDDMEQLTEALA